MSCHVMSEGGVTNVETMAISCWVIGTRQPLLVWPFKGVRVWDCGMHVRGVNRAVLVASLAAAAVHIVSLSLGVFPYFAPC